MSSHKTEARLISAETVEHYLRNHPEFFLTRNDLLMEIAVPHPTGGATSLVERQVVLLREQNRRYRRQLQNLVHIARTNDELIGRLQKLALKMLGSAGLDDVLAAIEESLRQDFHADAATLHLFKDARDFPLENSRHSFLSIRTIPAGSGVRDDIYRLLAGGRPVCGKLDPQRLEYLFGVDAGTIASTAVLPLTDPNPRVAKADTLGLLAIGSESSERFNPEMGTTYLTHLSELIGRKLAPCLQPDCPA